MGFLKEYLGQKAPKAGTELPLYYRRAIIASADALAAYFLLSCAIFSWSNRQMEWVPLALSVAMVACRLTVGHLNARVSTYAFSALVVLWCAWHTYTIGWSYGAQHLLIPVLMLIFFNIYEPTWAKLLAFALVVSYRMLLFSYSLEHPGIYTFDRSVIIAYQTVNSLTLFIVLAMDFALFSSSIQATERQLRLDNQELHREAGTDPLTQLPNRRAMIDFIQTYCRANPDAQYSVAIADIDFFKKVNDTYGHNCGDYTLKELARLLRESAAGQYQVCRWGGEEFCFFIPGKNLDEAGKLLFDLHIAVRKMPLHYEDNDFSISITIGVAENDFKSSMEQLLEQADQKLYRGKLEGRNRIVI